MISITILTEIVKGKSNILTVEELIEIDSSMIIHPKWILSFSCIWKSIKSQPTETFTFIKVKALFKRTQVPNKKNMETDS